MDIRNISSELLEKFFAGEAVANLSYVVEDGGDSRVTSLSLTTQDTTYSRPYLSYDAEYGQIYVYGLSKKDLKNDKLMTMLAF